MQRLTEIGGKQLSDETPRLGPGLRDLAGRLVTELLELLWAKNGFYAFESALHLFPTSSDDVTNLHAWNSATSWRSDYGELTDGCLFFAQDLVGAQFCILNDAVYKFDPETGDKSKLGDTINDWITIILNDHKAQTLWPLGHDWQLKNGPLQPPNRLAPRIPFVLGGSYSSENLYVANPDKLMRFYADLARQIHDLPDGAKVELKTIR